MSGRQRNTALQLGTLMQTAKRVDKLGTNSTEDGICNKLDEILKTVS